MNISTLWLPFTAKGWGQLQGMDIDIPALAWKLVLPMSLLPPIFLYFNGTHYGGEFLPGFADKKLAIYYHHILSGGVAHVLRDGLVNLLGVGAV